MSRDFAELDNQDTPIGVVSLRRRRIRSLDGLEIFEVKLGEEFLMSSLFTVVEIELARRGLRPLGAGPLQVVVGGLGLGYTAAAALDHASVESLLVVEFLEPVMDWHRRGMVPLGERLTGDPRCRFVHGNFFALAETGFDPSEPGRLFDAVLLDIDHSPRNLLHPQNAAFYSREGLTALVQQLRPGGVFGLWSDDPPEEEFMDLLRSVFTEVRADVVIFANPMLENDSRSTVYVARRS